MFAPLFVNRVLDLFGFRSANVVGIPKRTIREIEDMRASLDRIFQESIDTRGKK